ncbi:PilW family protein [Aeromonas veronii]|uniref:PilW family protein n=1 Tax=Aeromonas veronii TaxID=654 RepID=UPI001F3069D6|nr:PilW family protein [Aeromonas veronii]MCF5907527.1 PilW family protein [Aeromonas veronii]MCR3966225.1 PilW family protein [Aeromonas veronii]MCR3978701.1 PilW family protein [Aeromonas veronii]
MSRSGLPLHQHGIGLVEVMIALVLSLITVGVMIQVFLGNHKTYLTGEAIARVREDSGFATNLLQKELRMVGYQGCLSKQGVNITNTLNSNTVLPYNFTTFLRGYDNVTATLPAELSALFSGSEPRPMPGSDVLLVQGPVGVGVPVRRDNNGAQLFVHQLSSKANYCDSGAQGYSDLCEGDIVMVSDCQKARVFQITQVQSVAGGREVNIGHSEDKKFVPGNDHGSWWGASVPPEARFGPGAVLNRMETRLYYIARPSASSPYALYRKSGVAAGMPLIEGVANMQLTFGEDQNRDRATDRYVSAASNPNWDNVLGIGVQLLMRSNQGNVVSAPQALSFAGTTFQATDRNWYWVAETTVALRNRLP